MSGEREPMVGEIRRRAEEHVKSRAARWRRLGLEFPGQPGRESNRRTVAPFPRVSIVLATHRVERIEECRRQVLAQDYPNLELVIVLHNDAYDETSVHARF